MLVCSLTILPFVSLPVLFLDYCIVS